jgi:nitronate monooxygenase
MSQYRHIFDLADLAVPIIQAPMAGATTPAMVKGAIRAGALGSLPCAMLTTEQVRAAVADIRSDVSGALNLNFFCHRQPVLDEERDQWWQSALAPYYREHGLDPLLSAPAAERAPFDHDWCALVEELRPQVVSFHFGLPAPALVERVRATGARILSSATTLAEARWLADHGCDAIIVQGAEAGGHRGTFLAVDGHAPESRWAMAAQAGLFALLPQVVDVVPVPVIAAGGIADARGIAAALALGASAVQIGTAYLFTPEAALAPAHRLALEGNDGNDTAITNLFTGRPARSIVNRLMRELGPMRDDQPDFPLSTARLAPLRGDGIRSDFISLWAGQAFQLSPRGYSTEDLTGHLAAAAQAYFENH